MIRIACTNCKTILLIDDAFAGGVCRCQHCGTIQTVPSPGKHATAGAVSGQSMGGSKRPFQSDGNLPGTGLDDLANVVASSGLTGSGLSSRRLVRPSSEVPRNMTPIFIAVGGVIVALLAVIAWLAMRSGASVAGPPSNNSSISTSIGGAGPTPVLAAPNFCGMPIEGSTVSYVLDRGSATKEIFPALEDATLKSVASLGNDRRFQVLFWDNGSEEAAYPSVSTTYATRENIDAARRMMDAVAVFGSSDVKTAFKKALSGNPDVVVIASAKGWNLDESWADQVIAIRGTSTAKVDTVSLGSGGSSAGMKALAARTGGKYAQVNEGDLRIAGAQ